MSKNRRRLDVLLVDRGLFPSRRKAAAAVMAGLVFVDGQKAAKAGAIVRDDAHVEVRGQPLRYVSRGGLKLEKALHEFGWNPEGVVALDIGASTGGFTDCLLQNGARRVYAVDVGYGQLDWRLRNDPRVVVMERTNARYLRQADLPEPVDWIVIDVSFISLAKIFPAAARVIKPDGRLICLVKPQFEAGPERVGRKGVVGDAGVHRDVLVSVMEALVENGFQPERLTYSPVRGPQGNIEYLVGAVRSGEGQSADERRGAAVAPASGYGATLNRALWESRIAEVVAEAHAVDLSTT